MISLNTLVLVLVRYTWGVRVRCATHSGDPQTTRCYPRRFVAWASIVLVLLSEASHVSARVNEATKRLRATAAAPSELDVKTPAAAHPTAYGNDATDGTIVSNALFALDHSACETSFRLSTHLKSIHRPTHHRSAVNG